MATLQLIPNVKVQAPVSVELVLAMGLGAVLAWLYSVWARLVQTIVSYQKVRQKNAEIKKLEQNLQQYQQEIQSLKPTLPPAENKNNGSETETKTAESLGK
ncbi:MAG: LapA family protein [Nostocaceae cyanobacterium]|nr:LapA family protein [Nostocaceae cyanobacterium]